MMRFLLWMACSPLTCLVGCCLAASPRTTIAEPVDIVPVVHSALLKGDANALRPYLLSGDDLRALVLQPETGATALAAQDRIPEALLERIEKAIQSAQRTCDLAHSRITAFRLGQLKTTDVFWGLAKIHPTEYIEETIIELAVPGNEKGIEVELGYLMHVGDHWKLADSLIINDKK